MADIYKVNSNIGNGNGNGIRREDIREAITKAEELRALHAALMRENGPAKARFDSVSPVSCHAPQFSSEDYPVFTPSYVDEPLPGYRHHSLEDRGCWGKYNLDADATISTNYRMAIPFSGKGLPSKLENLDGNTCPEEDHNFGVCSCGDDSPVLGSRSRRDSLEDLKLGSYCNKCKPAIVSSESEGMTKNGRKSNVIVPYADSQSSVNSPLTSKGVNFSWLIPRIKKKSKGSSPTQPQPERVSQIHNDLDLVSVETLKKELVEANKSRDAALIEVEEMKSALGELSHKLDYLETYCEELKALSQDVQVKNSQPNENLIYIQKRGMLVDEDGDGENFTPVGDVTKVEGFLQIVSEARFSTKRFCRTLVGQIEETDHALVTNLNLLLQPYKLSLNSKYSKAILHLEAVINQSLYQDFENCVFQKNGSPKILNPQQDRHAKFQSFIALRNLSWNEVLRKGTKYYSDEFSNFCDDKMREIIATLGWTRPWSEQLLQAFFVAAKCIWLLHLLAFSFNPPLNILRVDENRPFEAQFMEDVFGNRLGLQGPSRVKMMVMPGFYVEDRVVKCKVLCKYKPMP